MEDDEKKAADYAAQQAALQQQQQLAMAEQTTAMDELANRANAYKASLETPAQREARQKQERATAILSGVTEGIGNIYNLVNASTNKAAVSVGGGAPITNSVKESIDKGTAERKAADDKMDAMMKEISTMKMANAQNRISALNQQMQQNREDYRLGKSEKRADAAENRAAALHPYQQQAAEAAANSAQIEAANKQRAMDDAHNTAVAQRKSAEQEAAMKAESVADAKRKNKYYDEHPEEFEALMKANKDTGQQVFTCGKESIKWKPQPGQIRALLNRYTGAKDAYETNIAIAKKNAGKTEPSKKGNKIVATEGSLSVEDTEAIALLTLKELLTKDPKRWANLWNDVKGMGSTSLGLIKHTAAKKH